MKNNQLRWTTSVRSAHEDGRFDKLFVNNPCGVPLLRGDSSEWLTAVFKMKRIYAVAEPTDRYRALVDRVWPRGVSKEKLESMCG